MQFQIISNEPIANLVYEMQLKGDTRQISKPGQFVQLQLPGFYLRRPISICDWRTDENGVLQLVFKVVGRGTEEMATYSSGMELDLLVGLGNGYDINQAGEANKSQHPLLVGGGVGVPPLYGLCKKLIASGKKPKVVLGFNAKKDVFFKQEFEDLGVQVLVTTVDGSEGIKGFVTDAIALLENQYDYIYTCGPEPMLKAVHAQAEKKNIAGQYSFEERMACGFGACMGCSCHTKYGAKRICKDGPVLMAEEIIW